MDKKIAGLLGAVAGLATMGGAHAATQQVTSTSALPQASSYAELLAPVSGAPELLAADDARLQSAGPRVQLAQDHHHHHHTKIIIKKKHHHHHHHRKIIIKKSHHHHHHSMYLPGASKEG